MSESALRAATPTLASALALGVLCSVPAALPPLVRALPDGKAAAAAVALLGAVSLLVVPLGLWLRRAAAAGMPRTDRALLLGTALSALPLALFGGVLKSTTHHRPLGGATFAVVAFCLLALCLGLAFRSVPGASRSAVRSPWQSLFLLACTLSMVGTLALGAASSARPSLVDFLALGAASATAGLARLPSWLSRPKAAFLLLGWAAVLVLALVFIRDPGLSTSLTTRAPVSFAALSWLGGGS